ncbi:MAG: hypothetical protein JNJ54_15825 [Myxococcaceae bacterium]|nr:hypothetical protein [Myxococcaceae bacterium]
MGAVHLLALALCLEACRCGGPDIVEGGGRVRVMPERLEFGDVWRGADQRLTLSLTNTGRAPLEVSLAVAAPFSLPNAPSFIPGAEEHALEVRFAPTLVGDFVGEVTVTHRGATTRVPVSGRGVEPPPCEPSLCRTARLDPESGACLQTPLADGTACASSCLESGVCQAGGCVGTPRSCDDGDACTVDVCHIVEGCQHTPVRCAPAGPCSSPLCSADAGCVDAPAPDGTPCGPASCAEANVCIGGACVVRQVPEGAPCGVETVCQPRGRCVAQQCDQPDASVIPREWSYAPSSSATGLVGLVADPPGNLYTVECVPVGGFGTGTFLAQCQAVSFSPGGQVRWRTPFPRQTNTGQGALTDSLTVAGEALVSWVERSFVSAFELSTGAHRWTVDLRTIGAFPANASYVRINSLAWDGVDRLTLAAESFVGSSAGSAVVILELRTGLVRGVQVLPGQGFSLVQSRRGDTYVAHSVQGGGLREAVSAFDRGGALQWQRVVPINMPFVRQLQATHRDQVLLTRRELLELVDTTGGALVRQGQLDGGFFSSPVWSDHRLFTIVQACAAPPCRSFSEYDYRLASVEPLSLQRREAPLARPFTFSPLWLTHRDAALFTTWTLPGPVLHEYDAEAELLMRCPLELERLRQLGGGPVLANGRYAMLTRRDGSSGAQQLDVWALPGYRPAAGGWVSSGGGPGHDGRAR